jgi:hypothetical protein
VSSILTMTNYITFFTSVSEKTSVLLTTTIKNTYTSSTIGCRDLRGFLLRILIGLGILNIQFNRILIINGIIINSVIIIHAFIPIVRKALI